MRVSAAVDACNVFEVEEGGFCDPVDVEEESESGVENDKVTDVS